tara:strand:+ start:911 stop:1840 length:930 start_codon:yes stop_codon:yes gene_type:complete
MSIKIIIIFLIVNLTCFIGKVLSFENRILFKVNNEIITSVDILNETKYLKIINDKLINVENKQIFEISKKSLIREKIKQIELLKYFDKLEIEAEYLNNLIINYFSNKIKINSIDEFEKFFINKKLNPQKVKKKIIIEVLWNQLIYNKFNQNVKIDKNLIKNDLINSNIQTEYLLSEIVFNIKDNETVNEKYKMIKKHIEEKNFSQAALIFSISDTANTGGKLGWINETSMNKNIKKVLKSINTGNFSKPIVIPGGFLILNIEEKRNIEKKYNLEKEIKRIAEKKTNEQLNQFSIIYFNKIKKDININEL